MIKQIFNCIIALGITISIIIVPLPIIQAAQADVTTTQIIGFIPLIIATTPAMYLLLRLLPLMREGLSAIEQYIPVQLTIAIILATSPLLPIKPA